ncbi:hypothetical protein EDD15DRAFT_2484477, partial [Pisolithus albus]
LHKKISKRSWASNATVWYLIQLKEFCCLNYLAPNFSRYSLNKMRVKLLMNTQALAEDQKDVERELERYEREQMTCSMGTRVTDLVRYWEQSETLYPLLFHVAMDVLPAQASAVPLMEALQILKFSIRGDRLSFTEDLLACEEDYAISGHLTVRAINELVETGKLDELNELTANAQDDSDLDDT